MKKIVLILLALILSNCCAASDGLPRLWEARKTNQDGVTVQLYLLAITHFGLPVEYDKYFYDTVIPRFKTADFLSFEGAGGREDEPIPVCDLASLDDEGRAIFRQAQDEVSTAARNFQVVIRKQQAEMGIKDPTTLESSQKLVEDFIRSKDDFELIQAAGIYLSVGTENPGVKGTVVGALVAENKTVTVSDVDTKFGARRAYCKSGPQRISFFKSTIYGDPVGDNIISELSDEFTSIVLSGKILKTQKTYMGPLSRSFVCDRSEEWVAEMSKISDGKVHFFALGASHLHDFDDGDLQCAGVLSLLAKNGYSVSLVN